MSSLTLNTQTSLLIGGLTSISSLLIGQLVSLMAALGSKREVPPSQNPRRNTSCTQPIRPPYVIQLQGGVGVGLWDYNAIEIHKDTLPQRSKYSEYSPILKKNSPILLKLPKHTTSLYLRTIQGQHISS